MSSPKPRLFRFFAFCLTVSTDASAQYRFDEAPAFYAFSALVAAVVLAGVWKMSANRFAARERELATLVAEKTEELRAANEALQHLANSDGLTGVGNRRQFEEFLAAEWRRAIRFKTPVSLVLIDLDQFKLFNDTYGHHAGDECLKDVAAALKETIRRPTDLVARFGGEEFAIVLGGTDAAGALTVTEQAMNKVKDLGAHVTISAGVATMFVTVGMSQAELVKAADGALCRAKAGGRNCFSL